MWIKTGVEVKRWMMGYIVPTAWRANFIQFDHQRLAACRSAIEFAQCQAAAVTRKLGHDYVGP